MIDTISDQRNRHCRSSLSEGDSNSMPTTAVSDDDHRQLKATPPPPAAHCRLTPTTSKEDLKPLDLSIKATEQPLNLCSKRKRKAPSSLFETTQSSAFQDSFFFFFFFYHYYVGRYSFVDVCSILRHCPVFQSDGRQSPRNAATISELLFPITAETSEAWMTRGHWPCRFSRSI